MAGERDVRRELNRAGLICVVVGIVVLIVGLVFHTGALAVGLAAGILIFVLGFGTSMRDRAKRKNAP